MLLLADVFKNLRKLCFKIFHLDPANLLWAPGLAWQAALKKRLEVILELLTDIDIINKINRSLDIFFCC